MKYNYKPTARELRSSLKYRSKEYLLENTLHGVPYFVDPTRPRWERFNPQMVRWGLMDPMMMLQMLVHFAVFFTITWFLLTIASIVATFIIIITIWNKFQTEPTITGLDMMTEHISIEFPQIFLCFDWSQLNHSHLHKDEMFIHEQLYNWNWGKSIDLEPFKTVYENKNNFRSTFEPIIPDCNNLISNCTYRGIEVPCGKLFTKVLVSVGACCKLNALGPLKIMDFSWDLEFKTKSSSFPWRLYFTQNLDSSPIPCERPIAKVYFPINIEFIVDITYTTPDIRYLTLRQRECYFKQEGVRLNDCEINCFIDRLLARCNCLPWFLSSIDKAECPLSKYSCLNNTSTDMSQCNCWISCDHTSYTVKGMMKSTTGVNRIMLRNWPTALYKREMRFGYLDLLVSFGGIAGLFMGYSLLTSVELGYYFSLRTYCGAVIRSSRKRYNITTVHVVEKLPRKTDLKPGYYQYIN